MVAGIGESAREALLSWQIPDDRALQDAPIVVLLAVKFAVGTDIGDVLDRLAIIVLVK